MADPMGCFDELTVILVWDSLSVKGKLRVYAPVNADPLS